MKRILLILAALSNVLWLPSCSTTTSQQVTAATAVAEQVLNAAVASGKVKAADADLVSTALAIVSTRKANTPALQQAVTAAKLVTASLQKTGALTPDQALEVNLALSLLDLLQPPAK